MSILFTFYTPALACCIYIISYVNEKVILYFLIFCTIMYRNEKKKRSEKMYSFNNDYSEGACYQIVEALIKTNLDQSVGYGTDTICEEARNLIRLKVGCQSADVHFLVGGTQANLTVIASALRPYEAVIAVESGHINAHETGSIEATGHKVVVCDGYDGKVSVEGIRKAVVKHEDEHMVKPAMVYISNATEVGTFYTLKELQEIHDVCKELGLYLFMDGARMPMALVAEGNDVTLQDIAQLCDVFYLGGTKCGALFGEAVVIVNEQLKKDFRYMIKQRGGMLAKGRLLGIQFKELFKQDLYFDLAKHAVAQAQKIQAAMKAAGIPFVVETKTNQIFPILENSLIAQLQENYQFQVWEKLDDEHTAMRFVTSWATDEKAVDTFIEDFKNMIQA